MKLRESKRVYSTNSIETWFKRLQQNWEANFNRDTLNHAQNIYRNGEIRELDLNENDAIVRYKFKDTEVYVLIDWIKNSISVRSSTSDKKFSDCLAAAGLYEIEELIADTVSPIEIEKSTLKEDVVQEIESQNIETATVKEECRDLYIKLKSTEAGLIFNAYWEATNSTSKSILNNNNPDTNDFTSPEREKIIRLSSLAHKAGFIYDKDKHQYFLSDFDRITEFLRIGIKNWKKHFNIISDNNVAKLKRGIQTLNVEIDVRKNDAKNGISIGWNLRLNSQLLTGINTLKHLKQAGKTHIIPEHGMFKISEDQTDDINDFMATFNSKGKPLPKYMIFSIFLNSALKINLSNDLNKWKNSLTQYETDEDQWPKFLRPYQKDGSRWLNRISSCECHGLLADEMGLGKTLQTLALISKPSGNNYPNLIVCPASVISVWKIEIEKFFPHLDFEILRKNNPLNKTDKKVIWLASYTQLRRHKALLSAMKFDFTVLDEAQFIKNPDAKTTIACLSINSNNRIALTGTPLENKYLDIWTIFRFLMPGLLGNRSSFENHSRKDGQNFMIHLNKQLSPFILRRTKKEVLSELPDKLKIRLSCPLSELQKNEYKKLTETGIAKLGDDLNNIESKQTFHLFTLLTRLRQVCCDPDLLPRVNADLNQSGKVNILLTKISEAIDNNHKIVIFSQFVSLLKRVRTNLEINFPDIPLFELTGKTVDREKPVAKFQNLDGKGIFLISLKAGGTGINLHTADYVFLLDPWWNPAVEEQAIDRVHRFGQKNTVFVYRLISEGTIEEKIEILKSQKQDLFDNLIGSLSNKDILSHFKTLGDLINLKSEDNLV